MKERRVRTQERWLRNMRFRPRMRRKQSPRGLHPISNSASTLESLREQLMQRWRVKVVPVVEKINISVNRIAIKFQKVITNIIRDRIDFNNHGGVK